MVASSHVSNALGTINPVRQIIEMAHKAGRPGAGRRRAGRAAHESGRAGAGLPISTRFSGHKMFGPTGIGVLYGKTTLLKPCRPIRAAAT